MTSDKILDDIRDNVIGDFSRHHLVDKQDLANIKRSFGLDDVQRHNNDQDSVLSWIKEWESSDENPVLYYKLQVLQFLIKCFFFCISLKKAIYKSVSCWFIISQVYLTRAKLFTL